MVRMEITSGESLVDPTAKSFKPTPQELYSRQLRRIANKILAVKTDIRISVCQMSIFRDRKTAVKEVKDWLPRLHCIVVGPGMGRNPTIIENVKVSP